MEKGYLQSKEDTFAEVEKRIRAKDEEELVTISLYDHEMDTILLLERIPEDKGIRYTLDLDIDNADAELNLYFDGIIDDEILARTYLMADDLLSKKMKDSYMMSSWGQLQLVMMNGNEKTMEMLIFLDTSKAEEGRGIYLRMELDEAMTRCVRDSLLMAYKKYKRV